MLMDMPLHRILSLANRRALTPALFQRERVKTAVRLLPLPPLGEGGDEGGPCRRLIAG